MLFALNSIITTIVSIILGLFIYLRDPNKALNRYYFGMASWIGVWVGTLYLYYTISDPFWVLWIARINFAAPTIGLYYLFKFIYEFPRREIVFPGWLMAGMNTIVWVVAGVTTFTNLVDKNEIVDGAERHMEFGVLYHVWALVFVGLLVLSMVMLLLKIKKIKTEREKTQLKYVLVGMGMAFVMGTTTNLILPFVWNIFTLQSLGSMSVLWLSGWMAYAIVRHQFLDITALVARTVAYTLLIGVVVGIEVVSVVLMTRLLPFEIDQTVVAVSASVLIILGYDSLRRIITKLTERIFYKGRYNTEELLSELTHIMAGTIEIKKLTRSLLTRMSESLKLSWAGIILVRDGEIVGVESVGREKSKLYDLKLKELLKRTKREVYVFEDLTDESLKDLFREKGLSVAIPLMIKKKEVGILVLGPKASGDVVSGQDRQFLSILAPQAAVAINNARSYREIQEFSKTLEKKVEERTEELREAQKKELAKADELLKLKDEFVFIASHDLASPVTAITGYIDMLRMSKVKMGKQVKEGLEAIDQASERLKDLVDDLLQVARGESGTIKVELVDVKVGEVVEKSLRMVEGRAKKKKIKIVSKMPKTLGKVRADKDKLSEVMDNLLTNAVKYGKDKGEIVVRGKRDGGWVVIEVEDDGIGIPKSEQGQIFTKFFRSETREARSESGTGLGLFVVNMLVRKMKGKISFESEDGKGTKFVIKLKRESLR